MAVEALDHMEPKLVQLRRCDALVDRVEKLLGGRGHGDVQELTCGLDHGVAQSVERRTIGRGGNDIAVAVEPIA